MTKAKHTYTYNIRIGSKVYRYATLDAAVLHANRIHSYTGIIVGIEKTKI